MRGHLGRAGCGHVDYAAFVRLRHAGEAACPESVSPVGRQQYMAWGCGAAGVYTCRHRGPCSLDGQLTRGGYTD